MENPWSQLAALAAVAEIATALLSWLERQTNDRKAAGLMSVLGITSLCPWERHLTLIF